MSKTKRQSPPWDDYKTQFVAVAAIRYCHGRCSYAPSLVCEWVRQSWAHLDAKTRDVLIRDTQGALDDARRAGSNLGYDVHHRGWVEFLNWMEGHQNA